MSDWTMWALDVTHNPPHDKSPLCFCPIEDGAVIVGMNVITFPAPGKLVAIFHEDGQEACDAWAAANDAWFQKLRAESDGAAETQNQTTALVSPGAGGDTRT